MKLEKYRYPKRHFKNVCYGVLNEFYAHCFPHIYTMGSVWASMCSSQTLGACVLFIWSVLSTKRELSTQTQLKSTSLTWQLQKTEFAPAIMLAITQLYSLCMFYFQNLNFNQAKLEGRRGLVLSIGSEQICWANDRESVHSGADGAASCTNNAA